MTVTKHTLRLAAAGAISLLCCTHSAFATVTMKVTMHVHQIAAKAAEGSAASLPKLPADTDFVQDVTLGDDYIDVKGNDGETIYDFKARKRYSIDFKSRSYVEYSLYDVIGFRSMEYANRTGLQQMLAAGKVNAPAIFVKAPNEQLFSIEDQQPSTLEFKERGGEWIGSSGADELARWSLKGSKAVPADVSRFVQFMRYARGGHPQVLARLAQQGIIPAHVVLTTQVSPIGSVCTIDISEVKTTPASAYDLHAYARRQLAPQEQGFADLLDRAQNLGAADVKAKAAELVARRDMDFQDGKLLPALLDSLEWNLVTGEYPMAFDAEKMARIKQDPDVKKFIAVLSAHSREETKPNADALAAIRAQLPQRTAALAVFEANQRAQSGDAKAAAALYRLALQANPELSGCYKDLGDFLYTQFQTDEAWRSWDVGRKLAPRFPNVFAINDLEHRLAAQYPAYFN